MRDKPYDEVVCSLIKIPGELFGIRNRISILITLIYVLLFWIGIGKKVADCISLMSLDKLEAIPVDTHVLSIAKNQYNFVDSPNKSTTITAKKSNNLTDKAYREIGNKFRTLWGDYGRYICNIYKIRILLN